MYFTYSNSDIRYKNNKFYLKDLEGVTYEKTNHLLCIICFFIPGCTGSFQLTNTVYDFHRDQSKWVDEILFLALIIVPVYEVSMFVDGLVLNSIEFWTGKKLLRVSIDPNNNHLMVLNGSDVSVVYYKADNSYIIQTENAISPRFKVQQDEESIMILDTHNNFIYRALKIKQGGLQIYDAFGDQILHIAPETISSVESTLTNQRGGLVVPLKMPG